MKVEISVPEVVSIFKEVPGHPERLFEMMRVDIRENVGRYLSGLEVSNANKELIDAVEKWRNRDLSGDLKNRGLQKEMVAIGIMDGLPGLEKVFKEEFLNAEVQCRQVHVARNVPAKIPKKLKQEVADDMRSIFYASSKKKAVDLFNDFKTKWEKQLPSSVKRLSASMDACLTLGTVR